MYIYLAGRYGRRLEILKAAEQLEAAGHVITGEWINGEHEAKDETGTSKEFRTWANNDLGDITDADAFVFFAESDKAEQRGRGGRFVELGYALALHHAAHLIGRPMDLYAIGEPEPNIFTHLREIQYHPTVARLIDDLFVADETKELEPCTTARG